MTDGDNKREKFLPNEQKAIIDLYDRYTDKTIAMRILKNMPGLENMYERKIKRWKSSTKTMGKPVSQEFEDEVYKEYQQLNKDDDIDVSFMNVSTVNLKQCGLKVLHRDYWDITTNQLVKKWHNDPHTSSLQFTNKWVSGFIRRIRLKLNLSSSLSSSSSSTTTSSPFLNPTLSSSKDNKSLIENLYVLNVNSIDSYEDTSHLTHSGGGDINQNYHYPYQRSSLHQQSADIPPVIPPTQYLHQSEYPVFQQQHDPHTQLLCPHPSINQLDAIIENLYHEDITNDDNTLVPAFDDFDLSFINFD